MVMLPKKGPAGNAYFKSFHLKRLQSQALVWAVYLLGGFQLWLSGASVGAAEEGPQKRTNPSPKVIQASDMQTVNLLMVDSSKARLLVDHAVTEYFGEQTLSSAWKRIVGPSDRVGIKIQTIPGPVMSTRKAVVDAVIQGLREAGVKKENILVFDQYALQMENAGFEFGAKNKLGTRVTATVPDHGYDPDVFLDLPIPGKLIWGDFEFQKDVPEREEQLSTKSHFTKILTSEVDKVIHIAVPTTHPGLGLYGAHLGCSLGLIDNGRRFQRPSYTREDSLTEILSHAQIQKKVVLHIVDALIVQYAGGPAFDPEYCTPMQSVLVSQDPIALDRVLLAEVNRLRPKVRLEPLPEKMDYLEAANLAGLSSATNLTSIVIRKISP
jgi:uncharacterized protein (DUF362 family)